MPGLKLSDKARGETAEERLVELKRKRADDVVLVHEIYASVQGESTHAGRPCVFVRTTGCHLRCAWCDTEHSFHAGTDMTIDAIIADVEARGGGVKLVEITGGEPLLQRSVFTLVKRLLDGGFEVLIETSGAVAIDAVDPRAKLIVDAKAPGSGEESRNIWKNIPLLVPGKDELKIVIADERDYEWAKRVLGERGVRPGVTVLFSPVWGAIEPPQLAEWIVRDNLEGVRFQLQMHKVLWGERTGV